MSQRRLPTQDKAMTSLLGEMLDRIARLENGSANAGLVSFENIRIGDVTVTVAHGAGLHRTVVFTNLLNGLQGTIVL